MKEDILEQIATDYLNLTGYFTLTNVRYRPSKDDPEWEGKQDSVHSDIDVVGFNPLKSPPQRVVAISCKSWQSGFWAEDEIDAIAKLDTIIGGRERWRSYRELASPKWGRAFRTKITELTGEAEFEYWLVCTKFCDPKNERMWTENVDFRRNLTPHLRIVPMDRIFSDVLCLIHTTPAGSELGRLIQLLKVAFPDLFYGSITRIKKLD